MKILFAGLLLLSATTAAFGWAPAVNAPEVTGATAVAGVGLITGAFFILRARRK